MSNTVTTDNKNEVEQESSMLLTQNLTEQVSLKPLHRQFTTKFFALMLSIVLATFFTSVLFYQHLTATTELIEGELKPLQQHVTQLTYLNKSQQIISQLLPPSQNEDILARHHELVKLDEKLLQLKNKNTSTYQQWLRNNKAVTEKVTRLQQSYSQNQQLKQSNVIQLQLMLFSITRIVDKKLGQQTLLYQQFKSQLTELLMMFEQLNINTSPEQFELLKRRTNDLIAQAKVLKKNSRTKAIDEFGQQIDTFKGIVLTEQRALAKWQGYLRLAENYHAELNIQQHQLIQLLTKSYKAVNVQETKVGSIERLLLQYKVSLSTESITVVLLSAAAISLLFFCYLLWSIRQQIKQSAQQNVTSVSYALQTNFVDTGHINSAETEEIIRQLTKVTKPKHSEHEFQQLAALCQTHEQVIAEQQQQLQQQTEHSNQQQLENTRQFSQNRHGEMQRYMSLKNNVVSLIQGQQVGFAGSESKASVSAAKLHEQITLFHLISYLKSDDAVLTLNDINFINEIQAIVLNKLGQCQFDEQQLFFSFSNALQHNAKVDGRLFTQLVNLFIDIILVASPSAQCHLQLQLQGKSAGQQQVNFKLEVTQPGLNALPDSIDLLINTEAVEVAESSLISAFHVLFVLQHGDNLSARLVERGYQLSFTLPLAIADDRSANFDSSDALKGTNLVLLSNNGQVNRQVTEIVNACSGKLTQFARIDSFEQHFSAKQLEQQPCDLLVVSAESARNHISFIEKKIAGLPHSLQPKVMVLQTDKLKCAMYGFYSVAEQPLFNGDFLSEIKKLLASSHKNNQLFSPEQCQVHSFIANPVTVLLAVSSPPQYQTLQRLLQFLGLQVHIITNKIQQRDRWQTGRYCLLLTEFTNDIFLTMENKPLADIGLFSLAKAIPADEKFKHWHLGQLSNRSALDKLSCSLAPWLKGAPKDIKEVKAVVHTVTPKSDVDDEVMVITEVATSILQKKNTEVAFDFSRYLHHQGSAEMALFMLEDYSQDNHAQLDLLINAIQTKDINKASDIVSKLQLNAKILSADELQLLCTQWSAILNGNDLSNNLNKVNDLLKDMRTALIAIDDYADTI